MLLLAAIIIYGVIKKRGWFYWLFSGLALTWLSYVMSMFMDGDTIQTQGPVAAYIIYWFNDGIMVPVIMFPLIILSYVITFWLVLRGNQIEKEKTQPFTIKKEGKLVIIGMWIIILLSNTILVYDKFSVLRQENS
jgi:hypothetical protein